MHRNVKGLTLLLLFIPIGCNYLEDNFRCRVIGGFKKYRHTEIVGDIDIYRNGSLEKMANGNRLIFSYRTYDRSNWNQKGKAFQFQICNKDMSIIISNMFNADRIKIISLKNPKSSDGVVDKIYQQVIELQNIKEK